MGAGLHRHLRQPAALFGVTMNDRTIPAADTGSGGCRTPGIVWLLACCVLAGCGKSDDNPAAPSSPAAETAALPAGRSLAAARLQVARARLADHAPEEALVWLAGAVEADPSFPDAIAEAAAVLTTTRWHVTAFVLDHGPVVIDQLRFAQPGHLWVSLTGTANATVRWDLDSLRIASVLFPIAPGPTRSLILDPAGRSAVVERAGFLLLCDARTLKPMHSLGRLPESAVPAATISFSPDGLLMAHPEAPSTPEATVVWRLRDVKTGGILRSSEPQDSQLAACVAAYLDRDHLRLLGQDGTLFRMPVSPLEAMSSSPPDPPFTLRHAVFSANGQAAFAAVQPGPHEPLEAVMIDLEAAESPPPAALDLLATQPWSRHPGIWSGLMSANHESVRVEGARVRFPGCHLAGLDAGGQVTALTRSGEHLIVGTADGKIGFHFLLPPLQRPDGQPAPAAGDSTASAAFSRLAALLSGLRLDSDGSALVSLPAAERRRLPGNDDLAPLGRLFPGIDVQPWLSALGAMAAVSQPADALAVLEQRLERATVRRDLPAIEEAYAQADHEAVMAAIREAGPKGPAAAKNLELALASTRPEWIDACLATAAGLPPLLRRIATSRIAWLQERKADAIAGWPDAFPDLREVRLREDWDGWEQADFSIALENLRLCVGEELAKLELPANSNPEQRTALFNHLTDPATVQAVGKPRFAKACLRTALAFAAFKEETERTFQLASLARNLGESPAVCLRAEAMALTALGDFVQARERWVDLITNHPLQTHEPGDYAEAAYTSFENADPRQAMAILTTGIHRFPHDAHFALRAGWVALLTGNPDPAYRFLLAGRQIGYPEDKLENATALLAIAAVQTGAIEDAGVFYEDLIRMDEAWRDPQTIETLEWPEELKASLRQLAW